MGFFRKLLNVGVTAGATVAAMKVAEKYKQNNPDGVTDQNGDGKVDTQDVLIEVKKAATEVYHDAADVIREKGPGYVEKAKQTVSDVVNGKQGQV